MSHIIGEPRYCLLSVVSQERKMLGSLLRNVQKSIQCKCQVNTIAIPNVINIPFSPVIKNISIKIKKIAFYCTSQTKSPETATEVNEQDIWSHKLRTEIERHLKQRTPCYCMKPIDFQPRSGSLNRKKYHRIIITPEIHLHRHHNGMARREHNFFFHVDLRRLFKLHSKHDIFATFVFKKKKKIPLYFVIYWRGVNKISINSDNQRGHRVVGVFNPKLLCDKRFLVSDVILQ